MFTAAASGSLGDKAWEETVLSCPPLGSLAPVSHQGSAYEFPLEGAGERPARARLGRKPVVRVIAREGRMQPGPLLAVKSFSHPTFALTDFGFTGFSGLLVPGRGHASPGSYAPY